MDDATLIATWFANITMGIITSVLMVLVLSLSITELGAVPTIIGVALFVAFIAMLVYLVKE